MNLTSFAAFVLGMMAMGNVLLPLRESLYNSIWLGVVLGLFPEGARPPPAPAHTDARTAAHPPAVTVKNHTVLETLRSVRNVVSDKTGTLTEGAWGGLAASARPLTHSGPHPQIA